MTATDKADELRAKLFALLGEFKDFALRVEIINAGDDPEYTAARQADAAACELAAIYDRMSGQSPKWDLFIDFASDRKDQKYRFTILDEPAPDFGLRLKTHRETRGLTVQELAEQASLSRQAVHNYESGERRPTWDAVQRLAKALGVSTDTFRDA